MQIASHETDRGSLSRPNAGSSRCFLPRKIVQSQCRKVHSEGRLFSLIIGSCLILVDMFSRWSVQILGALLSARAKRMKHQWQ